MSNGSFSLRFSPLRLCACGLLLIASTARASIELPLGLSSADRQRVLQIVGLGSSSKLLTDPYPLGGYWGIEAGVSIESLSVNDIAQLGQTLTPAQSNVTYPKIDIGKGLYNNVDLFLQFTPYTAQDELSQYGGIVRWGFYQSASIPLSLSASINLNSADVSNLLTSHSYGLDVVCGMNVSRVAIFGGVGYEAATGTFLGGRSGLVPQTDATIPVNSESEAVSSLHLIAGADVKISNAILALQVDRYTDYVFSGKLGVRF